MFLHTSESLRKTWIFWCTIIVLPCATLGGNVGAWSQEPPPLEAPELEAPRAPSSAPVVPAPPAVSGTRPQPRAVKPIDPALAKPIAKPAATSSAVGAVKPGATMAPRADSRPMLAIPGLTTPAARTPLSNARPPAIVGDRSPTLAAPADRGPGLGGAGVYSNGMRPMGQPPVVVGGSAVSALSGAAARGTGFAAPAPESVVPGSGALLGEGVRDSIPLGLEPIADDPPPARTPGGRAGTPPLIGTDRAPVRSTPGSLEDDPNVPAVIRRNFGRIQRYLGQPPAAAPRPLGAVAAKPAGKPIDPEPDAVTKKRLEKELRGTLGDRVRSVEVRVSGRNVLVAAKPVWFWQRRGVKRSIETMPALQNYRVRVDLDD